MAQIISVVICTYNRANLLKKALQSVVDQTLHKTKYEIIVLDDGSTDDTYKRVKSFQEKYTRPVIKFYKHGNLGLAHSRNIGIKKANGKYIAYLDDDAVAHKNWLKEALFCFKNVKPRPQAVTGPIFTYYQVKKPVWFKDSYEEDVKGTQNRFLKKGEALSGPNMIIDKSLIEQFGGFNESIDMKADILQLGEETTLFERLWEVGRESVHLYYSPKVIVYHLIHPYKMTIKYRLKRWFASGHSYYLRNKSENFWEKMTRILKVLVYLFMSLFFAIPSFLGYGKYQNWIIERIGPLIFCLGFFTALIRLPLVAKHRQRI